MNRQKGSRQARQWLAVFTVIGLCGVVVLAKYYFLQLHNRFPYREYFSILFWSMAALLPVSVWIVRDECRFNRLLQTIRKSYFVSLVIVAASFSLLLDIYIDILFYSSFVPLMAGLFLVLSAIEIPLPAKLIGWLTEVAHKLALVLGTVTVCLIFAEIAFRYVVLENMVPETPVEFERLFVEHWPRPVSQKKDDHSIRIIGLSDSFGEFGEQNNYHYLLEKLNKDGQPLIEVVNFSKGGYAPIDQLSLLERFGSLYHPDIVLHGFFVGNDFHTPQHLLLGYKEMDLRPPDSFRPRFFVVVQWLQRLRVIWRYNFRLWMEGSQHQPKKNDLNELAVDGISRADAEVSNLEDSEETTEQYTDVLFSEEEFWQIEKNHLENCHQAVEPEKYWEETIDLLERIRQQAERMGSRYMMVIHPARIQVEGELLSRVKERYAIDMEGYDLYLPQKFLLNFCREKEVTCLDLLPDFLEEGNRYALFLPNDIHYNSKGNQLAAQGIFRFLKREGLISAKTVVKPVSREVVQVE